MTLTCIGVFVVFVTIVARTDDHDRIIPHYLTNRSLFEATSDAKCLTSLNTSSSVIDNCQLCFRSGQTRSRTEGRWYNFSATSSPSSTPSHVFYVYSAFVDDRPPTPVIRFIAITTQSEKFLPGTELLCFLLYADGRTYRVSALTPAPNPIGMGLDMHGNYVQEFIYTCRLPSGSDAFPIGVSMRVTAGVRRPTPLPFVSPPRRTPPPSTFSVDRDAERQRCFLPVEIPPKPAARRNLAVCVQVAFGDISPVRLVEWFELQRILGVDLIGVYAAPTVSRRTLDVLRRYATADDRFVELRLTDFIGPVTSHTDDNQFNVSNSNQHLLHGSPVINDCLYRNMHSFRYIGVYDFDEVIFPRSYATIPQLLDALNSRGKLPISEFIFNNNYFFTDLPPDTNISTDFTTLRYRRKVAPSPSGYSVKSIIDPRSCVAMHNHYCWHKLDDGLARWHHSIYVELDDALLHHYKKCHFSSAECQKLMNEVSVDDTALKYRSALMSRVDNSRIHYIQQR